MGKFKLIVTITIVGMLFFAFLGGCESEKAAQPSLGNKVANLIVVAGNIKDDLSTGDKDKLKVDGPRLEEVWAGFEDTVKAKYPDSYAKVETFLDPALAGIKADPVDVKIMHQLLDQLIQTLEELKSKIPADPAK